MVPVDQTHPGTPGARFVLLFRHLGDGVCFAALDRAAGVGVGVAKQLRRGKKAGPSACVAFAPVFGVEVAWLLLGHGRRPGVRAVRAAVQAATAPVPARRARVHRRNVAHGGNTRKRARAFSRAAP